MIRAVAAYFNPFRYRSRLLNHQRCVESLKRQGVPCLTVECAFEDQPFELESSAEVLQFRTDSWVWQKERLINIGAGFMPRSDSILVVDGDITFNDDGWVMRAEAALERYAILQPWVTCQQLNRDGVVDQPLGHRASSFAFIHAHKPHLAATTYAEHGETGYAWVLRRELFDVAGGLYESAIIEQDHLMAHAAVGSLNVRCLDRAAPEGAVREHLLNWAWGFWRATRGKLGYINGTINHHWHGFKDNRRYYLMIELGFEPSDLTYHPGQLLEWTREARANKPELVNALKSFLQQRNEDG